jgi:hypothetical protein
MSLHDEVADDSFRDRFKKNTPTPQLEMNFKYYAGQGLFIVLTIKFDTA